MFARDALLPWRTAQKNVEFALEIRYPSLSRAERSARALRALDQVGLKESANFFPWQLSQGMRQRTALARTWAIEPTLLLMDEPFAALDAQTRTSVQEHFLDVWSSDRKSVVFVTHDITEAILLADRIVVMSKGRVVDETAVNIPRPRRHDDLVESNEFRELHHRLISSIRSST